MHSNRVNEEEQTIPEAPDAIQTISIAARTMFRIHIEIECALHLPLELVQGAEPTTYVSFEALAPNANEQMSSLVYTTDVIECSSSPQWNKQYEVSLPVDFLTDVRCILIDCIYLFVLIGNWIAGSKAFHFAYMEKR